MKIILSFSDFIFCIWSKTRRREKETTKIRIKKQCRTINLEIGNILNNLIRTVKLINLIRFEHIFQMRFSCSAFLRIKFLA